MNQAQTIANELETTCSDDLFTATIDDVVEGVVDATVSANGAIIGQVSLIIVADYVDTWGTDPRHWASEEVVTYLHAQPHAGQDLISPLTEAVSVAFAARRAEEAYQASKVEAAAEDAWDERRDDRRYDTQS